MKDIIELYGQYRPAIFIIIEVFSFVCFLFFFLMRKKEKHYHYYWKSFLLIFAGVFLLLTGLQFKFCLKELNIIIRLLGIVMEMAGAILLLYGAVKDWSNRKGKQKICP